MTLPFQMSELSNVTLPPEILSEEPSLIVVITVFSMVTLLPTVRMPVFAPVPEPPIFKFPPVISKLPFSEISSVVSQLRTPPLIVDSPPKKDPVTVISALGSVCSKVPENPELSPLKEEVPVFVMLPVPLISLSKVFELFSVEAVTIDPAL